MQLFKKESNSGFNQFSFYYLDILLVLILIFFSVSRIVYLGMDPPNYEKNYLGGVIYTDEGWYSKASQIKINFNEWKNENDINFYSHTFLYAFLLSIIFQIFGVGILCLRTLSVVSFFSSLFLCYALTKKYVSKRGALVACVVLSTSFYPYIFSRLGIIEPLACLFSLAALYFFIRNTNPPVDCIISCFCALLAFLCKTHYLFTFISVFFLWIISSFVLENKNKKSIVLILTIFVGIFLISSVSIRYFFEQDWAIFNDLNIGKRIRLMMKNNEFGVISNELTMFKTLLLHPITNILLVISCVSILLSLNKNLQRIYSLFKDRFFITFFTWLLLGVFITGAFPYLVSRYLYFTAFPITCLLIKIIDHLFSQKNKVILFTVVVIAQMGVQAPLFINWVSEDDLYSQITMVHDIVNKIDLNNSDSEVVVMGPIASFLSLFSNKIRPIESYWPQYVPFKDRINYWHPSYLLIFKGELQRDFSEPHSDIKEFSLISSYKVNCDKKNIELYKVVYNSTDLIKTKIDSLDPSP